VAEPSSWGKTYQSEHFRYHTSPQDTTPAETLQVLEWHLQSTLSTLGESWPEGAVVSYHKFLDRNDYLARSDCPPTTRGCYSGRAIRTSFRLHRHELIHAYADVLWGVSNRFVAEGLAVALSCQPAAGTVRHRHWVDLFRDFRAHTADGYTLAGRFVTHLLLTEGGPRFAQLYRGTQRDASAGEFRSVFHYIYGRDVDEVWSSSALADAPFCLEAPGSSTAPTLAL